NFGFNRNDPGSLVFQGNLDGNFFDLSFSTVGYQDIEFGFDSYAMNSAFELPQQLYISFDGGNSFESLGVDSLESSYTNTSFDLSALANNNDSIVIRYEFNTTYFDEDGLFLD